MGYQVTIKSLVMRILHLENPGVQQAWGRSKLEKGTQKS